MKEPRTPETRQKFTTRGSLPNHTQSDNHTKSVCFLCGQEGFGRVVLESSVEMKYQGVVKWFSNKKGFGFIAPTSDDAPTKEEIFVHQTAIVTDGAYRTLKVRLSRICDVDSAVGSTNRIPHPERPRENTQKRSALAGFYFLNISLLSSHIYAGK